MCQKGGNYMLKLGLFVFTSLMAMMGVSTNSKAIYTKALPRDTSIIVEVSSGIPTYLGQTAKDKQNYVLNHIKESVTDNFSVTNRYQTVTNAFVMDINSSYVDEIKNLPGVVSVSENKMHAKQDNVGEVITIKKAVSGSLENVSSETMNKPSDTKDGEGVVVAILDSSFLLGHEVFTNLPAGITQTLTEEKVKTLTAKSEFHGKPNSKNTTYYNSKVPFYYDYGGSTKEYGTEGKPDYDVYSSLSEHGQHVASITAGNKTDNFVGVAPNAQLLLMKVFTEYIPKSSDIAKGYTASIGAYDSAILTALEDCAILGADIVNLSLGSDLDDFDGDSVVMKTIERLQKNGMYINIAAGNSGKGTYAKAGGYANWTTDMVETGIMSSYANVDSSMTVAAGVPTKMYYETAVVVGSQTISYEDQITSYKTSDGEVTYSPERYIADLTKDGQTTFGWVKVGGWGEEADYKDIDVSGKIAVIDRGETTFTSKIKLAQTKGAVGVFIINNDPSETEFTFRFDLAGWTPSIPVASLLYRDRELFVNKGKGELSILVDTLAGAPNAYMATDFTTDGARYDLALKPEITAPGESILGAVFTNSDGTVVKDSDGKVATDKYGYYSGTSMATPNYCGAVAILLGEHLNDAQYKKTINMRTMSTATLMYDGIEKNLSELTSPRIQGAGMVNIKNALESEVYLEGLSKDGTTGINKAKIQLFNNKDIASGSLKLSFLAHNESNVSKSYVATTYIYNPELVTLNEDNYPQFKGKEFMSINNTLIEKVTQDITIPSGDSKVTLNTYELSEVYKAKLNEKFPNGTYIEGFVVLEEKNTTNPVNLSIPYLGFYGDFSSQSPVEPFKFERDSSKVYASDLLNNLLGVIGKTNGDFASTWVVGHADSVEDIDMDPTLLNDSNITKFKGFSSITADEYSADRKDPINLYIKRGSEQNMMIIQQTVLRSVTTNTITFTNKKTGEVVLTDHMFDSLFGGENVWTLYKSHASTDYISSGIIAHRAYSIIPLFDSKTKALWDEGTYEVKFTYELAAGGSYEKVYNLHFTATGKAPKKSGCGGSIIASSSVIAVLSLMGIGLVLYKKRKEN